MRLTGLPCSLALPLLLFLVPTSPAAGGDGNRLAYLDGPCDPYYVGRDFPKLTTPQWVGQPGVEAVIVLAIDDLRDVAKYENFLRPILDRLEAIDGRAPISLMTNQVDPADPQLKAWLEEGLSLESHTWTHRCPCLQGGDLATVRQSYEQNVDLMASISGNRPVAFRMPCCDSMSSVSPRYFAEIICKTTPQGNFMGIDSSVFLLLTADDPALPRGLVLDADGRERFRKYVPTDRVMANLIEDYPYPYAIGNLIWEIPPLMPSDWDAQHLHGVCNPATVEDLKAAVDAVVIKQGIFSLCFHPHGWIRNDQIVEVIDYAVKKHGKKVKFLTFREVQERLDKNLLGGHPLRAANGQAGGGRVLDVNDDGYMDVVVGNEKIRQTRVWSPHRSEWDTADFPVQIVSVDQKGNRRDAGVCFGVFFPGGRAYMLLHNENAAGSWLWDAHQWNRNPRELEGLVSNGPIHTALGGRDCGLRLRDLDGDGICEAVVGNPRQQALFSWIGQGDQLWKRLPLVLPEAATIVDAQGGDTGLRLVDVDEDGRLDVVFSNHQRYSIHLFTSMKEGWSRCVLSGKRGDGNPNELPPIVRADGTNNGAWFKHRHMWVQNEDTGAKLPGHVWSRHFTRLIPVQRD